MGLNEHIAHAVDRQLAASRGSGIRLQAVHAVDD
jgi:hypothetical protein